MNRSKRIHECFCSAGVNFALTDEEADARRAGQRQRRKARIGGSVQEDKSPEGLVLVNSGQGLSNQSADNEMDMDVDSALSKEWPTDGMDDDFPVTEPFSEDTDSSIEGTFVPVEAEIKAGQEEAKIKVKIKAKNSVGQDEANPGTYPVPSPAPAPAKNTAGQDEANPGTYPVPSPAPAPAKNTAGQDEANPGNYPVPFPAPAPAPASPETKTADTIQDTNGAKTTIEIWDEETDDKRPDKKSGGDGIAE